MDARRYVWSLRNALALLSHSHDVTGIVQQICSKILMLGYIAVSHSFIAFAGEGGLSSVGIDK